MVDRSKVVWAYRLLLGREPESSKIVDWHAHLAHNTHNLVRNIMISPEFRNRYSSLFYPSVWVWFDSDLGFRVRVNLHDEGVSKLVIENRFERREVEVIRSLLKPGHVALDLGGNIGYFTLLMANIVGPRGHVHSFEARPDLAESIGLSLTENKLGNIVTVHQVALAERSAQAFMVRAINGTNMGGAYLSFDDVPPVGHLTIPVRVARLGDLLSLTRLDFIKIDIEGAEPLALSSFYSVLEKFRPVILSEIHTDQIRKISKTEPEQYVLDICSLGYSCRQIGGKALPQRLDKLIYSVLFCPRQ